MKTIGPKGSHRHFTRKMTHTGYYTVGVAAVDEIVVYDITDRDSFENLNSWLIEIEKNASKNVYKILVGNKCDMESERKVTVEQGKDFATQYGMKFFETSAKESTNVSDAFIAMTREIIKSSNIKKKPANNNNNVVINDAPAGQSLNKKGGCC